MTVYLLVASSPADIVSSLSSGPFNLAARFDRPFNVSGLGANIQMKILSKIALRSEFQYVNRLKVAFV